MNMKCRLCRRPIEQLADVEIVRYSARSYAHEQCWLDRTLLELKNRKLLKDGRLAMQADG